MALWPTSDVRGFDWLFKQSQIWAETPMSKVESKAHIVSKLARQVLLGPWSLHVSTFVSMVISNSYEDTLRRVSNTLEVENKLFGI